jgi:hypothetical protein
MKLWHMIKINIVTWILIILFAGLLVYSCAPKEAASVKKEDKPVDTNNSGSATDSGSIEFTANGEEFVRYGFIDKNGWAISFHKLYINLVDPEAYHPAVAGTSAVLKGAYWVDLAADKATTNMPVADSVKVGIMEKVPAGNYQSLKFKIRRCTRGEFQGSSLVMIGKAQKEREQFDFSIKLDEEMDFDGREGFVGDVVKGLLKAGGSTSVEMTFHFDHIFGDKGADVGDHVNTASVGFDYFKQFAHNGRVDLSQTDLKRLDKDQTGYRTLIKAIWTLGHLGEGHCEVSGQSSRADIPEAENG